MKNSDVFRLEWKLKPNQNIAHVVWNVFYCCHLKSTIFPGIELFVFVSLQQEKNMQKRPTSWWLYKKGWRVTLSTFWYYGVTQNPVFWYSAAHIIWKVVNLKLQNSTSVIGFFLFCQDIISERLKLSVMKVIVASLVLWNLWLFQNFVYMS